MQESHFHFWVPSPISLQRITVIATAIKLVLVELDMSVTSLTRYTNLFLSIIITGTTRAKVIFQPLPSTLVLLITMFADLWVHLPIASLFT